MLSKFLLVYIYVIYFNYFSRNLKENKKRKTIMSFCYLYIITEILCVIYFTIVTYYMHCKICKVHTLFVKNKICVTNMVFKTFVVNRINFMHYIYFIFMLYTLFVNATVCKHYKVKILKINDNRTNRSKVINRAIHILFHGSVNKLLT
jgi:membrane-associated HD superfamily phosphohydrolase